MWVATFKCHRQFELAPYEKSVFSYLNDSRAKVLCMYFLHYHHRVTLVCRWSIGNSIRSFTTMKMIGTIGIAHMQAMCTTGFHQLVLFLMCEKEQQIAMNIFRNLRIKFQLILMILTSLHHPHSAITLYFLEFDFFDASLTF